MPLGPPQKGFRNRFVKDSKTTDPTGYACRKCLNSRQNRACTDVVLGTV